MPRIASLLALLWAILLAGCGAPSSPSGPPPSPSPGAGYDANTAVPRGDPAFPPLGRGAWVVDKGGVLSRETVGEGEAISRRLQEDGIAEVVVVVIRGVKQPEAWTTHYGRWLKLGEKGFSSRGGNNGVVWLIRPDARDRVTVSVGRGLPRFTTVDYGKIIDDAKDYLNFGNFDKGVLVLLRGTDARLREIAKKGNAR
jgi:uncharacterized membrane protein YgcG